MSKEVKSKISAEKSRLDEVLNLANACTQKEDSLAAYVFRNIENVRISLAKKFHHFKEEMIDERDVIEADIKQFEENELETLELLNGPNSLQDTINKIDTEDLNLFETIELCTYLTELISIYEIKIALWQNTGKGMRKSLSNFKKNYTKAFKENNGGLSRKISLLMEITSLEINRRVEDLSADEDEELKEYNLRTANLFRRIEYVNKTIAELKVKYERKNEVIKSYIEDVLANKTTEENFDDEDNIVCVEIAKNSLDYFEVSREISLLLEDFTDLDVIEEYLDLFAEEVELKNGGEVLEIVRKRMEFKELVRNFLKMLNEEKKKSLQAIVEKIKGKGSSIDLEKVFIEKFKGNLETLKSFGIEIEDLDALKIEFKKVEEKDEKFEDLTKEIEKLFLLESRILNFGKTDNWESVKEVINKALQ